MHSDEPGRAAQVTVTGATAGFAFGARTAGADPAVAPSTLYELYADEEGAVIASGEKKLAAFGSDGTIKVTGKVHAESFESTSSRAFKTDIEPLKSAHANKVLDGLNAVSFAFTRSGEKHVGFIAEDVPDEVANETHTAVKVMDIVSVLSCVVKEQRAMIKTLTARVAQLEARPRD
ncbi:hypothetical protein T492DRAFT_981643 [Pavlovales sp. CCMP2436]|nr:hypothetical protein T492DRAFT_981643 [Pavlovales sp. CCMP2436]